MKQALPLVYLLLLTAALIQSVLVVHAAPTYGSIAAYIRSLALEHDSHLQHKINAIYERIVKPVTFGEKLPEAKT